MLWKLQSDAYLLEAIQNGRIEAYEELFLRYADRLHDFALKYTQDPFVAEELMMDVLFWLWQNRARSGEIKSLAPYLFRAVRNKVFNHLRSAPAAFESLEDSTETQLIAAAATQPLEFKEMRSAYLSLLDRLSPKCRKVFMLSREEQLSYAEIAEQLDISVKTVEGYISQALKFLRENLHKHSDAAYCILLLSMLL